MKKSFLMILVIVMLPFPLLAATNKVSVEVLLGNVWNLREDITIKQDGYADIVINNAQFQTLPFNVPPYYSLRFAYRYNEEGAWEFEINHLKLYLDTLPPDVQVFEISHGYNLFLLNRAWFMGQYVVHMGGGFIITHPKITVRNMTNYQFSNEGYYLSGAAFQGSVQRRFSLSENWFLSLEGKLVYALATIPIAGGSVFLPNRSFHANFGLGFEF